MSHDYVICVRNIRNKKFESEPGMAKFLLVPEDSAANNAILPLPEHGVRREQWEKLVRKECVHTLENDMEQGDILVFIHGYNNDQKTVMKRHRTLKQDMAAHGFGGTVVSFDWPSADNALNYLEDRSDARKTALRLVSDCILLLARLQGPKCNINVHLLAHSTGAYVIREAFDDADDHAEISSHNWTVSQIAFIGADISSGSMTRDDPRCDSLYRHCIRLTNYQNPHDSVLALSNAKRVGVAPRVGRVGLPDDSHPKSININCGDHYKKSASKRDGIIGTKDHSWHIGDPLFARDLAATLAGTEDRHVLETRRTKDGGELHLFDPDA